jgi:hypothetical protein
MIEKLVKTPSNFKLRAQNLTISRFTENFDAFDFPFPVKNQKARAKKSVKNFKLRV